MLGSCRLCGNVGDLQRSHILPKWVFRRIVRRGSARQPVLIENGTRRYSNDQDAEHLLCFPCEQRLCQWEDHVARLALQPDGTLPALEKIALLGHRQPVETPADGTALGDALALFAASVVWRSSISSAREKAKLGPFEDAFRSFLLGTSSRLEHAQLLAYVIDPKNVPDGAESASYPATYSSPGGREHQFMVPGLRFVFLVGRTLEPRFNRSCFLRTKLALVIDGSQVAQVTRRKYWGATPVGGGWTGSPK
jgi:hypothetical protein